MCTTAVVLEAKVAQMMQVLLMATMSLFLVLPSFTYDLVFLAFCIEYYSYQNNTEMNC